MIRRLPAWAGFGLALSLALGACGQAPEAGAPQSTDSAAPVTTASDDSAAAPLTTASDDSAAAPAVKTAMEATDPTTVAFGAGEPQFVKVFAFW